MTQRLDYQKLSAAGVRAVGGVYMYIVNSGLPKELVDLVFLRASQIAKIPSGEGLAFGKARLDRGAEVAAHRPSS